MSFLTKQLMPSKSHKGFKLILYILSFVIPFMIIFLSLFALHITPFGDHSLAITDAKYYLNGEMFFSRLLKGQENILYSFNNGLGGNEWSQFAWGGFNIGNLLSYFASLETIPSIFTWICTVNLALSGLTMYILLDYVNGHKGSNLIFSTSYAFIGFNVVNVYQTGFVLGPELLPLIALGLILIFRGKYPLLYIFTLAFGTFFDFYFAFHFCAFSLIFFIAYLCVHEKELEGRKKSFFVRWLVSSLIGGFLGAPMWLPTLKAYSGGGRLNQTDILEYTFDENMPFIQMFSKLFSGANSTGELVSGMPNIFVGILCLALVILYFMNKKIEIKRKRGAGIVLSIYLLTFYIHAFTLIMHGGTHTNWFPYRYSYVFSFLLICIAAEEFNYIKDLTVEDAKRCGIVLLIAALIVFSTSYDFISGGMVVLDFTLLLLMWLGLWFYKTRPDKAPFRTLSMLLLIIVSINMYTNFIVSTNNVKEWELDLNEYKKSIMVSGAFVDALNRAEDAFFRMEKDKSESDSVAADPMLYNYNGVSHSGPTERMFIHKGLCKLGINWFDMRQWYSEGVPAATDSLLGLKYILSERNLTVEKGYEYKIEMMGTSIYQSPYPLSVTVLSDNKVKDIELGDNAFNNLNSVWKSMTGENKDIFTEQKDVTYSLFSDYSNQSVTSKELQESASKTASKQNSESTSSISVAAKDIGAHTSDNTVSQIDNGDESESSSYIQYSFEAKKDGPIYYYDTSIPDSEQGLATPNMHYVGAYKVGDKVEGKMPLEAGIASGDMLRGYCVNLVFAYADNNVLKNYAEKLNARNITFNVVHENDLTGTFNADKDQRILFTLPWDEGWTCYIDGQKVPIDKTWDLFMSVAVPEGKHTYEMKFFPAWMNYGIYISLVSLAGLIVFIIVLHRNKNKAVNIIDLPSETLPTKDDKKTEEKETATEDDKVTDTVLSAIDRENES